LKLEQYRFRSGERGRYQAVVVCGARNSQIAVRLDVAGAL
jgi:hypothetical protein